MYFLTTEDSVAFNEYMSGEMTDRNRPQYLESLETRLDVFPAFHKVSGRKILVVGGGSEAAAKLRLLSETNARIEVVASEFGEEAKAAFQSNANIVPVMREFEPGDVENSVLVFAATGDPSDDGKVRDAAKAVGVPFNAVDRPDLCDFYTPALVNRAPVAVGICSTGIGPVLSRKIRARIEGILPLNTGALVRLAMEFRSAVSKVFTSGRDRLRFWAGFFDGPISTHAYAGDIDKARSSAQRLLNRRMSREGYVWLVGAGPGAEDLLTLRAHRLLQEADLIVFDQLVPESVVAMGRRDAERINVGKAKGSHSYAQDEINELLIRAAGSGKRVVRLKSGDPMVFGRVGEEIDALRKSGTAFEIVPGVTAALAAAASAELPLTLRGIASSLVFATGHDMNGETLPDWLELAISGTTVAVYMGRSVAAKVANRLMDAGMDADVPVIAVENASRTDETVFYGNLNDLAGFAEWNEANGPVLFVVGDVASKASLKRAVPMARLSIQTGYSEDGIVSRIAA